MFMEIDEISIWCTLFLTTMIFPKDTPIKICTTRVQRPNLICLKETLHGQLTLQYVRVWSYRIANRPFENFKENISYVTSTKSGI